MYVMHHESRRGGGGGGGWAFPSFGLNRLVLSIFLWS